MKIVLTRNQITIAEKMGISKEQYLIALIALERDYELEKKRKKKLMKLYWKKKGKKC